MLCQLLFVQMLNIFIHITFYTLLKDRVCWFDTVFIFCSHIFIIPIACYISLETVLYVCIVYQTNFSIFLLAQYCESTFIPGCQFSWFVEILNGAWIFKFVASYLTYYNSVDIMYFVGY